MDWYSTYYSVQGFFAQCFPWASFMFLKCMSIAYQTTVWYSIGTTIYPVPVDGHLFPGFGCYFCLKGAMNIYEKAMAPHSSTLAWRIPETGEPGGLQSMGSLRVGHNWATSLSLSLSCIGEGHGTPLQCSCLENPRDGGAWWAAVYGVTQSQTRLKRLSSSSLHYLWFFC